MHRKLDLDSEIKASGCLGGATNEQLNAYDQLNEEYLESRQQEGDEVEGEATAEENAAEAEADVEGEENKVDGGEEVDGEGRQPVVTFSE